MTVDITITYFGLFYLIVGFICSVYIMWDDFDFASAIAYGQWGSSFVGIMVCCLMSFFAPMLLIITIIKLSKSDNDYIMELLSNGFFERQYNSMLDFNIFVLIIVMTIMCFKVNWIISVCFIVCLVLLHFKNSRIRKDRMLKELEK